MQQGDRKVKFPTSTRTENWIQIFLKPCTFLHVKFFPATDVVLRQRISVDCSEDNEYQVSPKQNPFINIFCWPRALTFLILISSASQDTHGSTEGKNQFWWKLQKWNQGRYILWARELHSIINGIHFINFPAPYLTQWNHCVHTQKVRAEKTDCKHLVLKGVLALCSK